MAIAVSSLDHLFQYSRKRLCIIPLLHYVMTKVYTLKNTRRLIQVQWDAYGSTKINTNYRYTRQISTMTLFEVRTKFYNQPHACSEENSLKFSNNFNFTLPPRFKKPENTYKSNRHSKKLHLHYYRSRHLPNHTGWMFRVNVLSLTRKCLSSVTSSFFTISILFTY